MDLWRSSYFQCTWMSGNSTSAVAGVYGTKGVSSPSNYPGSRSGSVSWIDSTGSLWIFGGNGFGCREALQPTLLECMEQREFLLQITILEVDLVLPVGLTLLALFGSLEAMT